VAVALLAVLANLLIPAVHDQAARAADGERITICAPQGLVTIIVSDQGQRQSDPRPFNHLCPDCPSCPLCPTAHAPLAVLSKAIAAPYSPEPAYEAWPAADDISTPDRADWWLAFPRAPPASA
jgi:hypothetical protein